jgi:hypothetical protein
MEESEIIKQAAEGQIKNIFDVFVGSFASAKNDEAKAAAEQRFKNGILMVREARKKALNALEELP